MSSITIATRISAVILAAGLAAGGALSTAATASATDYNVNMHETCARQHGAAWQARLLDAGNAYSWRCWVPPYGAVNRNVDIKKYWCDLEYPGSTTVLLNSGNPYSWRCRL